MPYLPNVRWENMARNLAKGMSQTAAYIAAGYSSDNAYQYAFKLAHEPEIKDRVEEQKAEGAVLQREILEDVNSSASKARSYAELGLTREFVIAELIMNVQLAREAASFPASNRALELLGKELGMFGGAAGESDRNKAVPSSNSAPIPMSVLAALLESVNLNPNDFSEIPPAEERDPVLKTLPPAPVPTMDELKALSDD